MPEDAMNNPALRKQVVEKLALLVERFPNLCIGQIIGNALGVGDYDLYFTSDAHFLRSLNQLHITYTQFQAAGVKP